MSNTSSPAHEHALLVAQALREPLAKLGAESLDLALGIRRETLAIVVGLERLDAYPRGRSARRVRICSAVCRLLALLRTARALGDISEPDYRVAFSAVDRLVCTLTDDVIAERGLTGSTTAQAGSVAGGQP